MPNGKTVTYESGDWFAIPLTNGGYAIGIVARKSSDNIVLGYFFGNKFENLTEVSELAQLQARRPADALLIRLCSDMGILQNQWTYIGRQPNWDSKDWPIPQFGRYQELDDQAYAVIYDPDNPNKVVREISITIAECMQLPSDGVSGSRALELKLTSLIEKDPGDSPPRTSVDTE